MSDPASIKKALSAQFSVDVPPPLDSVDPEALATLLKSGGGASVTIIDVRQAEEFQQGHIRGARNIPLDELDFDTLSREIREKRKGDAKHRLVFASLQSPDIDDAAAQDFARSYEDSFEDEAEKRADPASGFAQLLLGGVYHWLQLYRADSTLTASYDAAQWDSTFSKSAPPSS